MFIEIKAFLCVSLFKARAAHNKKTQKIKQKKKRNLKEINHLKIRNPRKCNISKSFIGFTMPRKS